MKVIMMMIASNLAWRGKYHVFGIWLEAQRTNVMDSSMTYIALLKVITTIISAKLFTFKSSVFAFCMLVTCPGG